MGHVRVGQCRARIGSEATFERIKRWLQAVAAGNARIQGMIEDVDVVVARQGRVPSLVLHHTSEMAKLERVLDMSEITDENQRLREVLLGAGVSQDTLGAVEDHVDAQCSGSALLELLRSHAIVKPVAGSLTGDSCKRLLRDHVLHDIESMIPTEAARSIVRFLKEYQPLELIFRTVHWTPAAFSELHQKFPSFHANSVQVLANEVQIYTAAWAACLRSAVPWYPTQHYMHIVVAHAHQHLEKWGSIGLYSSVGIESTHMFLKFLVRSHWRSTDTSLPLFLLRRWRAKVMFGKATS
jgi:hypothetical protein